MTNLRVSFALLIAFVMLIPLPAQQAPAPTDSSQTTLKVDVNEVVVDLIVRDKKGKMITDLKPGEIEILEDNVRQDVTGLRLIEGREAILQSQERVTLDPLRQMRLVSLVFERLGPDAMKMARDAALNLVNRDPEHGVYFAVFRLEGAIKIIQPFTRDKALLKRAIEQATSGAGTNLKPVSQEKAGTTAPPPVMPGTPSSSNPQANGGDFAQQAMDRAIARMESYMDQMTREQQGSMSLTSLLALVKGQQGLAGRKTAIFFTEWFSVPQTEDAFFQNLLGEANRSNFSFYVVDAKGLTTWSQSAGSGDTLRDVTAIAGGLENTGHTNMGPGRTDQQIDATRQNPQLWMQSLATSTGGFLIGETNDFKKPMEKVTEDVWTYYEASYKPVNRDFDGKYRTLLVKVNRPNLVVQGRVGYFAMPPEFRDVLFNWEVPLLKSMSVTPPPKDVEYRAASYRFGSQQGLTKGVLSIEVPIGKLAVSKDEVKKSFGIHFSLMALIKDSNGQIVRKFQKDIPVVRELDKLAQYQLGNFTFNEPFELPPGKYTLETAVLDWTNKKVGTKRAAFSLAGESKAASISSLAMIRRVEPVEGQDTGVDPFRFDKGKVVPSLDAKIAGGPNAQFSVYMVISMPKGSAIKPQLILEFSRDGQSLGKGEAPLPEPDGSGRMPYIATIPAAGWPAGQYEIRAILMQGGSAVGEERVAFTIENAPAGSAGGN